MRAAWFVGRVGGLAVALGVGAAVTLGAPAAWADDTGSDGSDGSTSTTSTGAGETSESQDNTDTSTTNGSGGTSAPESGPVNNSESGATGSTGSVVRQTLPGIVRASGGAHSSTNAQRLRAALDDVVNAFTNAEPSTTGSRTIASGGTNRKQRTAEAPDEDATRVTTSRNTPSSQTDASPLRRTVEDYASATAGAKRTAAVQTPTSTTMRLNSLAVSQTSPAAPPPPTLSTVVLAALGASGLGQLTTNDPSAPVDSPLGLAMLAIGARSRQTGSSTTQSVDNSETFTALAAAVASAAPPKFVSQAPIAVGTNPSAVVIDPDGRMFVANTGSASVSVINIATGQRIDANPSSSSMDIPVGTSPTALALNADDNRLYVANAGSGTVSVIDTTTYTRVDANPSATSMDIKVGASPSALAFGADGRLYVANRGSNTVSVINTATNTLVDVDPNKSGVQSISVGAAPTAMAHGPDGRLYVANRTSSTVSVINTTTYGVTNTIKVGTQPSSLALGTDGRLYVVNTGARTVSVINTATNTVIDTNPNSTGVNPISVGASPTSVAFSPDGNFAYVANANDTISVIDTSTYAVVRTVAIDTDTTGGHVIAVNSNGTVYVTDAADRTVRVLAIRVGNAAPVAGTPTVGTPNTSTGVVAGVLNFVDSDGDSLSYSVIQPSTGTVSVTSTGAYTYTPAQAARQQAAQTPGTDFVTFTVNATDGEATTPISVTVRVAPAITLSGVSPINVPVDGTHTSSLVNADGTHAVITTSVYDAHNSITTRVVVINIATGAQVGTTVALTGEVAGSVLTHDSTRAVIITAEHAWTTGTSAASATVIDIATGTQIGTTLSVTGALSEAPLLSADGRRAIIITNHQSSIGSESRIAVIDTRTGVQIGTTTTVLGYGYTQFTEDRTYALITTSSTDALGVTTTRVALVDTTAGAQTGTTITHVGEASAVFLNDGTHALLTAIDGDSTSGYTTRVTIINAANGAQAPTSTLTGRYGSPLVGPALAADGRHVVMTGFAGDVTRIAVIDLSTGVHTEANLAYAGTLFDIQPVTADASRVLVRSHVYDTQTSTPTARITMVDSATGAQIGSGLVLTGQMEWDSALLTPDKTRAVVSTWQSTAGGATSRVAVIDTTTGNQVGTTLTYTGSVEVVMSPDGSRALVAANANGSSTQVAVVNTQTGSVKRLTLTGRLSGVPQFNAQGDRVLVETVVFKMFKGYTTRISVINPITGVQVGTAVSLVGEPSSAVFNADGTRAIITATVSGFATITDPTRLAIINTTTGAQIGSTLTFTSNRPASVALSGDGSRALVTTVSDFITRATVVPIA